MATHQKTAMPRRPRPKLRHQCLCTNPGAKIKFGHVCTRCDGIERRLHCSATHDAVARQYEDHSPSPGVMVHDVMMTARGRQHLPFDLETVR